MTDFIWPGDSDRAANDELNRVCEYLEEVLDDCDALAAHVESAKGIMSRLVETDRYMMGPRPPAVQEYLDWYARAKELVRQAEEAE